MKSSPIPIYALIAIALCLTASVGTFLIDRPARAAKIIVDPAKAPPLDDPSLHSQLNKLLLLGADVGWIVGHHGGTQQDMTNVLWRVRYGDTNVLIPWIRKMVEGGRK